MINGYELVKIPSFVDERGGLSFVECGQFLPFKVHRVYWLYDFKQPRGGHAHKKLKQFIFCTHGSVNILLDNGENNTVVTLNSPDIGLHIFDPLWREINTFKNNPQLVILASDLYEEDDYIKSYEEFKRWKSHF